MCLCDEIACVFFVPLCCAPTQQCQGYSNLISRIGCLWEFLQPMFPGHLTHGWLLVSCSANPCTLGSLLYFPWRKIWADTKSCDSTRSLWDSCLAPQLAEINSTFNSCESGLGLRHVPKKESEWVLYQCLQSVYVESTAMQLNFDKFWMCLEHTQPRGRGFDTNNRL